MSRELQFDYGLTGKTVVALLYDASGRRWNGAAFVAPSAIASSAWATGAIALAEDQTSDSQATGFYAGNLPGGAGNAVQAMFYDGTIELASKLVGAQDLSTLTAAAVWASSQRTLTGTGGAIGPSAGANLAPIAFGSIPPGQTLDLSACVSYNGQYATIEATSAIAYTIRRICGDDAIPITGHVEVDLSPADVLFDSLQSDAEASDYNFRFRPNVAPLPAFPEPGEYLITVRFTTSDQQYFANFRGRARW